MENTRSEEDSLRALALMYNEEYLFACYDSARTYSNVDVSIIKVSRNKIKDEYSDHKNAHLYDVYVRVSGLQSNGSSFPWKEMYEVKWEGKLQDWYQACVDIVKSVTTGDKE